MTPTVEETGGDVCVSRGETSTSTWRSSVTQDPNRGIARSGKKSY